jgi:hypothetical protein
VGEIFAMTVPGATSSVTRTRMFVEEEEVKDCFAALQGELPQAPLRRCRAPGSPTTCRIR